MQLFYASLLALSAPVAAFAAGGDETAPPKPKVSCEAGQVYDKKTKSCVMASNESLTPDDLYQTVRSLAYAGRYADAQTVLAQMPQDDDRTLTYLGFTHRKTPPISSRGPIWAKAWSRKAISPMPSPNCAQSVITAGQAHGRKRP